MKDQPSFVILGAGISGLLAGWALRKYHPTIIEANQRVGGDYTSGGLKYIRHTDMVAKMLDELGIPWSTYQPKGGIFWRGEIYPHPEWLRSLEPSLCYKIQRKHWLKTRGTMDGFTPTCMNDPQGEGDDLAIKCDLNSLMGSLCNAIIDAGGVLMTPHHVIAINRNHVSTICEVSGERLIHSFHYSHLVTTLPLNATSYLAPWAELPTPSPRQLSIVSVLAPVAEMMDGLDYLYTPEVRFINRISRFSREVPDVFHVEMPLQVVDVEDIPLLGKIKVMEVKRVLGHLPPIEKPTWPDNWLPLGRFAEWEPRSTAEKSLFRVMVWKGMVT